MAIKIKCCFYVITMKSRNNSDSGVRTTTIAYTAGEGFRVEANMCPGTHIAMGVPGHRVAQLAWRWWWWPWRWHGSGGWGGSLGRWRGGMGRTLHPRTSEREGRTAPLGERQKEGVVDVLIIQVLLFCLHLEHTLEYT